MILVLDNIEVRGDVLRPTYKNVITKYTKILILWKKKKKKKKKKNSDKISEAS